MNKYEKEEIQQLDRKYRPISAWGYFGLNILFAIPVIGQILLIVFCFVGSNINRRSYARSFFCALLVCLIIGVIMLILGFTVLKETFAPMIEYIKQIIEQIMGAGAEG